MSMLDSFFNKGFKGSKCKTLLKLTIPRIKLLRNRRELQIKQMRKDIAKLLETGQEATARIRVEHIIREENMMAAQDIIELFCELISVRLPIIETQRECPLDLKEAISSVCFAAPRCADLPELLQVQLAFASRYGKEFVAAATELMPDCGVNRQLIELLSVRAPSAEKKLKLLKEIAEEHGLDWDPAASETELFKSHEDLLHGSTQFASGSNVPLLKEKHEEVLHSASTEAADEQSDSDSGLDSLEFAEVPKAIPRPNIESGSTKEETHPLSPAEFPEVPKAIPRPNIESGSTKDETHPLSPAPHPELDQEPVTLQATDHELPKPPESRQFVPFISPPSQSFDFSPAPHPELDQEPVTLQATDHELPKPPESRQFVPFISPPSQSFDPAPESFPRVKNETTNPSTQSLPVKSEINVDLQDVLAAAQAAADTAECAAAAARSAASLAQVRISELSNKEYGRLSDTDNPFGTDNPSTSSINDKPHLDHQISSADSDDSASVAHAMPEHHQSSHFANGSSGLPSYNANEPLSKTPTFGEVVHEQVSSQQQPQRRTSMEDDLLSSYPNLFGSGGHSFTETPRSNT